MFEFSPWLVESAFSGFSGVKLKVPELLEEGALTPAALEDILASGTALPLGELEESSGTRVSALLGPDREGQLFLIVLERQAPRYAVSVRGARWARPAEKGMYEKTLRAIARGL